MSVLFWLNELPGVWFCMCLILSIELQIHVCPRIWSGKLVVTAKASSIIHGPRAHRQESPALALPEDAPRRMNAFESYLLSRSLSNNYYLLLVCLIALLRQWEIMKQLSACLWIYIKYPCGFTWALEKKGLVNASNNYYFFPFICSYVVRATTLKRPCFL